MPLSCSHRANALGSGVWREKIGLCGHWGGMWRSGVEGTRESGEFCLVLVLILAGRERRRECRVWMRLWRWDCRGAVRELDKKV